MISPPKHAPKFVSITHRPAPQLELLDKHAEMDGGTPDHTTTGNVNSSSQYIYRYFDHRQGRRGGIIRRSIR